MNININLTWCLKLLGRKDMNMLDGEPLTSRDKEILEGFQRKPYRVLELLAEHHKENHAAMRIINEAMKQHKNKDFFYDGGSRGQPDQPLINGR